MNPIVSGEVDLALDEEFPKCEEWTPVAVHATLVRMIARISGLAFVGPDVYRSKEYLDNAINYPRDVVSAQRDIKQLNPWLRPLLAPRLKSVRRLRQREARAIAQLGSIIESRRAASPSSAPDPEHNDLLSVLAAKSESDGGYPTPKLAEMQLSLIFASIHTTSETLTHV